MKYLKALRSIPEEEVAIEMARNREVKDETGEMTRSLSTIELLKRFNNFKLRLKIQFNLLKRSGLFHF